MSTDRSAARRGTAAAFLLAAGLALAARTTNPPHRAVDGYDITLTGHARAGSESALTVTVTKNGVPVTELQPYLGTYAHLTAIHTGDLAFTHLHSGDTVNADEGGPARW